MEQGPRIIVALDYADAAKAIAMADRLDPQQCRVKVGKEMFTRAGPPLVRQLVERRFDVFLDLKFHDIPTTVAQAVKASEELGVWMVNVHACGGHAMLHAARAALADGLRRPLLLGVTVLTSMPEADLRAPGVVGSLEDQVVRLAALVPQTGLDGVVCSAREARSLRARFGPRFAQVETGKSPKGEAQ